MLFTISFNDVDDDDNKVFFQNTLKILIMFFSFECTDVNDDDDDDDDDDEGSLVPIFILLKCLYNDDDDDDGDVNVLTSLSWEINIIISLTIVIPIA